jgi:hypothetical protein
MFTVDYGCKLPRFFLGGILAYDTPACLFRHRHQYLLKWRLGLRLVMVQPVEGSEFFFGYKKLAKGREKGERTGLQFLSLLPRVVVRKKDRRRASASDRSNTALSLPQFRSILLRAGYSYRFLGMSTWKVHQVSFSPTDAMTNDQIASTLDIF